MKKKMETSKKLLYLNYTVFFILAAFIIYCTFAGIECSNLAVLASCVAVEVGGATGFYYNMCKKLNMPKVLKYIYDELPEEAKSDLDFNTLLSNISN